MVQQDATVSIIRDRDPYEAARKVLKLLGKSFKVESGERVLIKPNCVRPSMPSSGVTTDARVVEPIVEYLKDRGVHDITIAEGGNPGTDKALKIAGFEELSRRHGLRLVNLNKDEWESVRIPGGVALKEVKLAKTVLGCDCLINVPKLKIHHMAQVTLSMKNLMGVIVGNRGKVMHHRLHEKIVDLASLFKPRLNLVDGVIGAEMDEVVGKPVTVNVVIGGFDMVATDAIGSSIMGVDPLTVEHIQGAALRGLGVGDLGRIHILGESIESVCKVFSCEYSDEKLESYNLSRPLSEDDIARMYREFEGRDPHVEDPYDGPG